MKIDDKIRHNRKVQRAGPAAFGLWVLALTYCQEQLTDGFIPHDEVSMLGILPKHRPKRLAAKLVSVGLWDLADGGYRVHDYFDFNPHKVVVKAARALNTFHKELYAIPGITEALKSRDNDICFHCHKQTRPTHHRGQVWGRVFRKLNPNLPTSLQNTVTCCKECAVRLDSDPTFVAEITSRQATLELVPNQVRTNSDPIPELPLTPIPISTSKEVHTLGAAGAPLGPRPVPKTQKPLTCPKFLPNEFLAGMGTHADKNALAKWVADTEARRVTEQPVVEDNIAWWRQAFKAWVREKGWIPKKPAPVGKRRASDARLPDHSRWNDCKHVPACPGLSEHRRLVEAELSGNSTYVDAVRRMHAKRGGL